MVVNLAIKSIHWFKHQLQNTINDNILLSVLTILILVLTFISFWIIIISWPFVIIWALNQLFHLQLTYTLGNWIATIILTIAFNSIVIIK